MPHGVLKKMKTIGFILSVVVVMFSAQPLMSALAQEKIVQEQTTGMLCCAVQTDCCCNAGEDAGDARECDSNQDCTDSCQCVAQNQVINAITGISTQINVFGVKREKYDIFSSPYHLILPFSIWHPPQS